MYSVLHDELDLKDIEDMLLRQWREMVAHGRLPDTPPNPQHAYNILMNLEQAGMLLCGYLRPEEDGELVGVIFGVIGEDIWTGVKCANEMVMYLDPGWRKGNNFRYLLSNYIYEGVQRGVSRFTFTWPDWGGHETDLGRLIGISLKRSGFSVEHIAREHNDTFVITERTNVNVAGPGERSSGSSERSAGLDASGEALQFKSQSLIDEAFR